MSTTADNTAGAEPETGSGQRPRPDARARYSKPCLTAFGRVVDHTLSGGSCLADSGGGLGPPPGGGVCLPF